ncbi:MAG: DUF4837 family protein [Saprospiraceae bacterium]|nr:DUF4837 family protein [Saprospiraceae bacterium]
MPQIIIVTGMLFSIFSCKNEFTASMANKPTAMGRINDVAILADKDMERSPVGDTLMSYFQSAYPVLPAEEPIFDIRFMSPEDLDAQPYRKELRIFVVVADVSDTTSATTRMLRSDLGNERFVRAQIDTSFTSSIGNDKWAKGQIIFYIFANGKQKLGNAIVKNFSSVAKRINQHDVKNLQATVYGMQGENRTLSADILGKFGVNLRIPDLYVVAKEEKNFIWLRMDTKEMNQSLIIRKFPYKDKNQFTKDQLLLMRNEYGKEFIQTGQPDAYMSTNVIDLPVYEYTYTQNGAYTKEIRGIWETVNDFMGGPFVSYLMFNEAKNEVVFIDAFVFAPGKNKRDFIQQLDCIVKTATFPDELKN